MFTNPNDPKDDPNPAYNGSTGRFQVSSAAIPAGFPTPQTTGFCGAGLRPSDLTPSGNLTITQNGAVIDGLDISGSVVVEADNVTIRNSQITATSPFALKVASGATNLQVENTRIRGVGENSSAAIFLQEYATLRRVHATGGTDVLKAFRGVLVEDSYLGGTYRKPGSHNDVVQIIQGSNYTFRHNTMLGQWQRTTSVFIFQAKASGAGGGPISNVLVENNYLSGGGYTIYTEAVDYSFTGAVVRNNQIENNSWMYGWKRDTASGSSYTGNNLVSP